MVVIFTIARRLVAAALTIAAALPMVTACRSISPRAGDAGPPAAGMSATSTGTRGGPRPAVIGAADGERRILRGGAASLLIKVDPVTTGSQRMVLGSSAEEARMLNDTYLVVFRSTDDGWKLYREVASSNLPPQARPQQ